MGVNATARVAPGRAKSTSRLLALSGSVFAGRDHAVFRSLRFQLIAIVVGTVATVLAASQWLDTTLSERTLERNLKERAFLALGTIDSLWGRADPDALSRALTSLAASNQEFVAVDVFRLDGSHPDLSVTTRAPAHAEDGALTDSQSKRLASGDAVTSRVTDASGAPLWRVAIPMKREGEVVGVAQADLSLAEAADLQRRLRMIDGVFLLLSIVIISVLLAVFLERRVARPVTALVEAMRRVEAGARGTRVTPRGGGEFAYLGGSLNRMLSRLEELTTGLESEVRRATSVLAEANEKLLRAQGEIARSERLAALGQLAATIAHELGTPLNSVLGYTQLLRRENLAPEQVDKLAIVESQVQRMIETIRSVLDRTRDRTLERTPVAVGPLVSEALALVSSRLTGRALKLRKELDPDLPLVPGDAVGLRQVLLNLLVNAIDATEPPGTITVSAGVMAANGSGVRTLEIIVRDTGHGMEPEVARRVFEPFYTTKELGRGTGLGLAIVDHVVRAHGGYVDVDTAPGRGTSMRVHLPLET